MLNNDSEVPPKKQHL